MECESVVKGTRSFSINGLRLTNAKTSFAAGFGLHHWSILEGEQSFYYTLRLCIIKNKGIA